MNRVALTPISRELIADALTPISAYLALAPAGAAVLLESVEGRDRLSRFSFIGLDPLASQAIGSEQDLLEQVRGFVDRYQVDTSHVSSYSGGVVVVFAYDAARAMERLGRRPAPDVAMPDAYCLMPGAWVVFDHFTHRLSLIGLAADGQRTVVERRLDEIEALLLGATASIPGPLEPLGAMRASMTHDGFCERVRRAQEFIRDGDVYQLQLGIRFDCEVRGEPFDFYRRIRAVNPSPYMFFVEGPFGAIFGASPEFLVRLEGGSAGLRPLAGTRPRSSNPLEDAAIARELLANEKERAEHIMLVDLGRNDLGVVARAGSVTVDELMQIERYSHVMHIVSNVRAELDPAHDALDLFAAAFPAGTVTGTPKIRAMQRIDELEPVGRGFYAGSIAHVDFNGDLDSCITLRSVQMSGGRAYWQASAGIVADSDPDAEYREVFHKTAVVRSVLGIVSAT